MKKINTEQVIKDFINVHNDTYNYSKVNYKNAIEKVIVICKIHGDFEVSSNNHKKGRGCPKCGLKKCSEAKVISQESIIESFIESHGDRYSYDKVIYVADKEKVIITCKIHGDFLQRPNHHKRGIGCSRCNRLGFHVREDYKDRKTILYCIKIGQLYKIGLTMQSVKKRYKYDNIEYEILSEEIFQDGSLAWDKEQKLLRENKNYYVGPDILTGGNTEIRTKLN